MHRGTGGTGRVTRITCAAGAAGAVLALTACSGTDHESAAGTADGQRRPTLVSREAGAGREAGVREVRLRARVTRVAGTLSDVRRERVARHARAAVLAYLEAASAGDRPWRGFVPALRADARADAPVLRSPADGTTDARAWFSVAAPDGRAVGVTARIAVEVRSDDGTARSLSGRLLLTEAPPAERSAATRPTWQVFGYDVARGVR